MSLVIDDDDGSNEEDGTDADWTPASDEATPASLRKRPHTDRSTGAAPTPPPPPPLTPPPILSGKSVPAGLDLKGPRNEVILDLTAGGEWSARAV